MNMSLEKLLDKLPDYIWPQKVKKYCSECGKYLKTENDCAYLGIFRSGNGWGIDYHTVGRDWQVFERGDTMSEAITKMLRKLKKDNLMPKKK